jgi:type IV pilus assembly protein PilO
VVIMTMHDISLKPRDTVQGPQNDKKPVSIGPNTILELKGTVKTYRYRDEEEVAGSAPADGAAPAAGAPQVPGANAAAAAATNTANATQAAGGSR